MFAQFASMLVASVACLVRGSRPSFLNIFHLSVSTARSITRFYSPVDPQLIDVVTALQQELQHGDLDDSPLLVG